MARRHYSDADRAMALAVLDSCEGKTSLAAAQLKIPESTLRRWIEDRDLAAPAELREEKKLGLAELFEAEIRAAILSMESKRDGASYRDTGTVIGILTDKVQLLRGEPTVRTEEVGALTPEQAVEMLRRYDAPKP